MTLSLAESLRKAAYFARLDQQALEQLMQQMTRWQMLSGETIIIEGDPAIGMWIIERGRVKIYKLNPEGEQHVLRLLGDGDTFNEVGALDGGGNPANAGALSESVLWLLPSEALRELILSNGAFALRIVQVISGLVQQIEDLALFDFR